MTVEEVLAGFWRYAGSYYVKDGQPTCKLGCIRAAVRPGRRLYAETPVSEFGPSP